MGLISVLEFMESRDDNTRTYKGIVVDTSDPNETGRVRVFIKGKLEGDPESLPWCSPEYPIINGGSPSNMNFSVPELGAIVAVEFKGGNPYVPVYRSTWVTEDMSPSLMFGEDYPNTSGSITPSGSFSRTNSIQNYSEYHHNSGAMVRFNNRGDMEVVSPRSLMMRVDGDFLVNNNYWQSCGGGMGNVIEELLYAVIEGPFINGLLDMIAVLPGAGDSSDPNYISIDAFSDDLLNLVNFANSLSKLDPDMEGLDSLMKSLDNRSRIQRAFVAFDGIEGLVNMLFMYFGLFGVWNSKWLGGSEDIMNATLNSLQSLANMELVLLGKPSDLEAILGYPPQSATTAQQLEELKKAQSQVTADVIKKMITGFTALSEISPILKSCDALRKALSSVSSINDPKLVIDALPKDLNTFVLNTVNDLFTGLMVAVSHINPKSQIAFLDRFGLTSYFSMSNATTEMVRGVVKELLATGVDSYELGMSGHLVGRAIIQDQKDSNDSIESLKESAKQLGWSQPLLDLILTNYTTNIRTKIEKIDTDPVVGSTPSYLCSLTDLVAAMAGYGFYKEKIMKCIEDIDFDYPVGSYSKVNSGGVNIRKVELIGYGTVKAFLLQIYELKDDASIMGDNEGGGNSDGMQASGDNTSLSQDLANMGEGTKGQGLTIPGTILCYMGAAIGNLCRASSFRSEASRFLSKDLADKLDTEPPGYKRAKDESSNGIDLIISRIFADVYRWYIPATIPGISKRLNEGVLAKEMSTFLVGLDLHGLLNEVVPYRYVGKFVSDFVSIARPRASFAYGGNLHQILASGMIDLVSSEFKTRLSDIETKVYLNNNDPPSDPPINTPNDSLAQGTYYPKTYWYSILFGCPTVGMQPGYTSMYKRARQLDLTSKRMLQIGEWFRSSNLQFVENETSKAIGNSITADDVAALKAKQKNT